MPVPLAVIDTLPPTQTPGSPLTLNVGAGFTVTIIWSDDVQPFASVTLSVYVVVDDGDADGFAMFQLDKPVVGVHE